jgi:formylglycine-generating enzyme required for sulfatase activity
VIRGGSWDDDSFYVRSSFRTLNTPGSPYYGFGFRVARTP